MLCLLDTAHWLGPQGRHELPDTLPGWTIAVLAIQADWVAREQLQVLLWPDAGGAEAQHNLRLTLHRLRDVLSRWGVADRLQSERRRVRLVLASDVGALRAALTTGDPAALQSYRKPLLQGMSFPSRETLAEWVQRERGELHSRWRVAMLARIDAAAATPLRAAEIARAMLAADPNDEAAALNLLRSLQQAGQRADALQFFAAFRARLQSEIGVQVAPELLAAAQALEGPRPAPAPAATARDGFFGREVELSALGATLGNPPEPGRLVTVLGPGGVGKSRLVREFARREALRWPGGLLWVALADMSVAEEMWPRLAAVIDLALVSHRSPQAQVHEALAQRHAAGPAGQVLFVLDNAEHLSFLPELLAPVRAALPGASWVVTSRLPLDFSGERRLGIEGLEVPAGDVTSLDEAMRSDALRLLHSRVRVLNPAFDLAAQWLACVALIRRVGGWPLAIELAAPALVMHDATTVLADLAQTLDALAAAPAAGPARHDSVRASLDLSWKLLDPGHQQALARLSAFRGGFTRVAAFAVTGAPGTTLATLIGRSLVQVAGGGRFDLHPLVAQYATERLSEDPAQARKAVQRHAEHYLARLLACAGAAGGTAAAAAWTEIEADFENFRLAWKALVERAEPGPLALCAPVLSAFGSARGRAGVIALWMAEAMPVTTADAASRLALLQAAANLRMRAGEYDLAQALARDGLRVAQRVKDAVSRRALLNTLALTLKEQGFYDEADACAQTGLRLARAQGSEAEIAMLANTAAILANARGDHALATALYEEAIAVHRRSADPAALAKCLNNLGNVQRARSELESARQHYEESLRLSEQHGIASTRAFALVNLAIVHLESGRYALAQTFAQRARAEPAAELGVLLSVHAILVVTAIELGHLDQAAAALEPLAQRARQSGLNAGLLEAVGCHAKLLAATGQRAAALARLTYLSTHAQTPALQRSDVEQALRRLDAMPDEIAQAQAQAAAFELDSLVESAAAAGAATVMVGR